LPSNSTSNLHRLLHPLASLSDQPPACAGYCVLRFCQRSTSHFHRIDILRRCRQSTANLRWLLIYRRCQRSIVRLPLDIVPSGFAFLSASDLRRLPTFRFCLPINLWLTPQINRPVLPSCRHPTCVGCQPSSSAFQPIFDLRLRSIFRLAFRPASDFHRRSHLRPCPWNPTPDFCSVISWKEP